MQISALARSFCMMETEGRGSCIGEADAVDVVHEHLGGHDKFTLGLQRIH